MNITFKKLTATALAIGMALSMGTSVAAESNFSFSDIKAQVADLQASSTGWKTKDGKSYYYKSGKLLKNTYVQYKGYYYYVDKNGVWDGKTRGYYKDCTPGLYFVLSIKSPIGKYTSDFGEPVDCSASSSDASFKKVNAAVNKAIKEKKSYVCIDTYNKKTNTSWDYSWATQVGFCSWQEDLKLPSDVVVCQSYTEICARLGNYNACKDPKTGARRVYMIFYNLEDMYQYMKDYEDMDIAYDLEHYANGDCFADYTGLNLRFILETGKQCISDELKYELYLAKKEGYSSTEVINKVLSLYKSMHITDDMTDLEKMERIYALVIDNMEYGWCASPLTGLMTGYGVCEEYSSLVRLFAQMAGVDCKKVGRIDIKHAWNAVKIDGEWRHFDVTWDDTYLGNGTPDTWIYFNKTEAEFAKALSGSGKTHGSNADDYITDEFNLH